MGYAKCRVVDYSSLMRLLICEITSSLVCWILRYNLNAYIMPQMLPIIPPIKLPSKNPLWKLSLVIGIDCIISNMVHTNQKMHRGIIIIICFVLFDFIFISFLRYSWGFPSDSRLRIGKRDWFCSRNIHRCNIEYW